MIAHLWTTPDQLIDFIKNQIPGSSMTLFTTAVSPGGNIRYVEVEVDLEKYHVEIINHDPANPHIRITRR